MKSKLHESLRKFIQQEIKAVLTESTLSGDYDKVKNKLPKKLRQFCDVIKNNPKFTEDLQYITYDSIGKKLKFSLDSYSEAGMNMLLKLVKQTVKLPEFKSLLKFNAEEFGGEDIELDIKNVQGLNENTNDFKVGEIYRDKSGVEYQITPMPDKFKGKWGAGTLNVWVTNLDTDEKHFMPVTMLKDLKQVYVTPTAGRKMLGRFESVNEGPEEYRIGTIFTVLKSPDSKFMRGWKAFSSVMYEPKIQPKKGDKFEIIKPEFDDEHISFRNLNRPEEILNAYGPVGGDDIKNAVVSFPSKWFKELESKGYFKVDKIGTGNNVFDYKSTIGEGPEEMGAYRRLVVTSSELEKMKTEMTKFMNRADIKSMYTVRFKMIDSPKPNTVVVDVEGDKATVVATKLSDLAKKLDKSVTIMVRKERKLK